MVGSSLQLHVIISLLSIAVVVPLCCICVCLYASCCTVKRKRKKKQPTNKEHIEAAQTLEEDVFYDERIPGRLDFVLQQEGLFDVHYMALATSHFTYWTNPDVAGFVLNMDRRVKEERRQAEERERLEEMV